MNARPIYRFSIWLTLLSVLVIFAGMNNGADAFGLNETQTERLVDVDVFDDDLPDPFLVSADLGRVFFGRVALFVLVAEFDIASTFSSHLKVHQPTGPPLSSLIPTV